MAVQSEVIFSVGLSFAFFMASNAYDIQMVNTEKLQADIKKKQKKVKVKCTCDHLKHWV